MILPNSGVAKKTGGCLTLFGFSVTMPLPRNVPDVTKEQIYVSDFAVVRLMPTREMASMSHNSRLFDGLLKRELAVFYKTRIIIQDKVNKFDIVKYRSGLKD